MPRHNDELSRDDLAMTGRDRELYDINPECDGDVMDHPARVIFAKYLAGLERVLASRAAAHAATANG